MMDFGKTIQFKLSIVIGLYVLVSLPIALYLDEFLHVFMAWNLILALVPLYLAYIFRNIRKQKILSTKQQIVLVLIFLAWLFFLPNAFYVITDLIHLGNRTFYHQLGIYMPLNYVEDIKNYVALLHIFMGAIIALTAGVISLLDMTSNVEKKFGKISSNIFVLGILFLSSIAIYIGRFLRFNSWDILDPFRLLEELIQSINLFFVQFILLFWFSQVILYYFYAILLYKKTGDTIE